MRSTTIPEVPSRILPGSAYKEENSAYCVAGPCAGRALTPVPLEVKDGFVLLADGVDIEALAGTAP